ncbi:MAG: hypothetical protein ACR2M0_15880 [Chloroflexia bacterium]
MAVKTAQVGIIQLGMGRVGRALIRRYLDHADAYPQISYIGIGDRSGLWLAPGGIGRASLAGAVEFKQEGMPLSRWMPALARTEFVPAPDSSSPDLLWRLDELGIRKAILVDATTPDSETAPLLIALHRAGYDVVPVNKAPLAGSLADYDALTGAGRGRTRIESALGAALPLAAALRRSARGGDRVRVLLAMGSPALNAILDAVSDGKRLSTAAADTRARGLLHSDPQEDLSGHDLARTTLILARLLGRRAEPTDLGCRPLLPHGFDTLPPGVLWERLPELDAFFAERAQKAARRNNVLRYLARIEPDGLSVGMDEIPVDTVAGRLEGSDTLYALYTEMSEGRPFVYQAPGQTHAMAAAAALAEIAFS